jgi:hypothetical protein
MSLLFTSNPVSRLYPDLCVESRQLGFVVSTVGMGKSTLCTLIGLDALLADFKVLHISLNSPQRHLRMRYEQTLEHLLYSEDETETIDVRKSIESNRLLHSILQQECSLQDIKTKVQLFTDLLDFQPDVLIIDGLSENWTAETIELWTKGLESENCMTWITTEKPPEQERYVLTLEDHISGIMLRSHDEQLMLTRQTLLCIPLSSKTLNPTDVTIFSGGTMGAEAQFGTYAEQYGVREVNFTFEGHQQKRTVATSILSAKELSVGATSLSYVSKVLNRNWKRSETLQKVVQVLWHIVSHADQVFVVGVIQPDGTVHGGTGWSVELAKRWHKPVWVFDQDKEDWFQWNGRTWISDTPIITSRNIAGSGTRFLNHQGKIAIKQLFERSFVQ